MKTPVLESPFNKVADLRAPIQVFFSAKFAKFLITLFFTGTPPVAVSEPVSQQLFI